MNNFKFEGYKKLELNGFLWETKNPSAVILIIHGFGEHAGRLFRSCRIFKLQKYYGNEL